MADPALLEAIASLLGVNSDDFLRALTLSHLSTKGEMIAKSNSIGESVTARNSLAKGLYSRLFDYVVRVINKLLR